MKRQVKRRFGGPWDGYWSAGRAHECPPDKAYGAGYSPTTTLSFNEVFDPLRGKFFRRAGSSTVGGASGILENGTGDLTVARARELWALYSDSLADGYPTHALTFTEEGNVKGCVYLRSTDGGVDYTLGMEFSSSHYPGTNAATANIKCVPYYRTSDGTYDRLNSVAARGRFCPGHRRGVSGRGQRYFGSLKGTPRKWNGVFNESSSSGANNNRTFPIGHIPPPLSLSITEGTGNASGVWQAGDQFYISVAYIFADGSWSMPAIPRDINDDLTSGLGRILIVTDCNFITWSGIPIGPDGCIGRALLRTAKKDGSGSGSQTTPSPLRLRVTAIIPNNTQTTYVDTNGNDLGLAEEDPINVRFDRIWMPPCRYMGTFDGRGICGYTNPNPQALILMPNVNVDDDSATTLSVVYEFDIGVSAANTLTLKKDNSAGTAIGSLSTKTLQEICDEVNATVAGGSGGKWYAVIVPGADASATGDKLQVTTGVDVGDSTYAATGRIRSYSFSYPAIAMFTTAYLTSDGKDTEKQRIFFTQGGPGAPSHALDSWLAGNYRPVPESWGIYQGSWPLLNGCMLFYSRKIGILRNIKSGKSGEDQDYRVDDLFTNLGCIAWDSITGGDGWAGCLTNRGFAVFDGQPGSTGFTIISGDVWNPATQQGEWAYEIGQCLIAIAKDDDSAHFHAYVEAGKLHIRYRRASNAADSVPNRRLVYDFSLSASGSGLAQVLRPDGRPWGWSTPLVEQGSVGGFVPKSTGLLHYAAIEANLGTTNGRVDQFDTGTQDNGSGVSGALWGAQDFADTHDKKQVEEWRHMYLNKDSGLVFQLRHSDGSSANGSTVLGTGVTLPQTGANGQYGYARTPMGVRARAGTRSYQPSWTDDGTGEAAEIWGSEALVSLLDSKG